jgi:VWFA-related protein
MKGSAHRPEAAVLAAAVLAVAAVSYGVLSYVTSWRGTPLLGASGFSRTVEAQAQTPPPPQPTFRTEANYVRVDVFPTRDGAPATDLTQADFEVLESGVPQKIEQFEHVVIRAAGSQDARVEPNTVGQSRSMAQSSRARLFVIFLDTYHVDVGASHAIRKPLVDALDRLIGQDDLVGVMTPEMAATDVTFARRTTTIDGLLTRYWHWGERDRMNPTDPEDEQYGLCYPNDPGRCADQNGIAAEMIDRRHEKRALDALQDLVRYLHGVREERKAILAITNGWLLYRPDQNLVRPLKCHGVPTGPGISVDPRSGRLGTREAAAVAPQGQCDVDRMTLAQIDDDHQFREILDESNRANASFYPIDPRGLAVFDTPIVRQDVPGAPPAMTPLPVDRAMLLARNTALRTLAEATDGLAIVDSNDLAGGLRRVVTDLSSYYLLGYYSSGKLDGRFHPISVRVKQPGIKVRARRGYLAATPADVTAAARASATAASRPASDPTAASAAVAHAVEAAIGPLAAYGRDVPLRVQIAAGWKPGDAASAALWVVGELGGVATIGDAWNDGFDATVTLNTAADPAGASVAGGRVTVPRGARTFRVALTASQPIPPGDYVLRVGARAGPASIPSRDTARLSIPPAPDASGAIFVRRGASTGNKEVPTADLRFRRTEQVRVELPTASSDPLTARLLDRTGRPLAVPVTAALRDDSDGSRWQTAQLALAPLAPGDYVIEMAAGDKRTITAFKVIP